MLAKLIDFAIRQRWLVLLAVLGVAALGAYNLTRLPIDAVPDITNVQVQINTDVPGYSPLESEQRITFPIETAMAGLPNLDYTRSLSRYGLSQVTVVFKEGVDIYFARQQIGERLNTVKDQLPPGVSSEMGPVSTGLGEIFMYSVEPKPGATDIHGEPPSPTELRTVQDWIIKPQLRQVPGVNEVNSIGGYEKQYHVTPDPQRLLAYNLSLRDIMEALAKNNQNVGAGYIERKGEQYLIRVPGQVRTPEDIGQIIVSSFAGAPVCVRDVAEVALGKELRTGAATIDGRETVLGTTFMLIGENSRTVSQRVAKRLEEINRTLPSDIEARTVYDRTTLVDATIKTVEKNLTEGAILVVVVLLLLLGNLRAAVLTALVIPLSMLFTTTGMVQGKISGNLMSLGALDFGIIVDGAVIIVENCIRRLAEEQAHHGGGKLPLEERFRVVREATVEVVRPSLFGSFIIMIVYLPLLTLSGVEGKLFTPMALTVILALVGAMVLSVTFVPAAVAVFLSGKISEKENILMRAAKALYVPALQGCIAHRLPVAVAAAVLVVLSFLAASRMSTEFVPSLDEGDLALQTLRMPGTGLEQSVAMQGALEKRLKQIPEVKDVFARVGTAEVASDPMPPSIGDGYVMLKPQAEWPNPDRTKAEITKDVQEAAEQMPGNLYEVSQPIQLRFNELISGVRSDLGVKVFGEDLDELLRQGQEIGKVLEGISGAADVKVEQVGGLPMLTVELNRTALARYGLNVADVQEIVQIALGGKSAGTVYEGDRRFDLIVRLPERERNDLEKIKRVPVPLPDRGRSDAEGNGLRRTSTHGRATEHSSNMPAFIPLSAVADFSFAPGPNQISRENGKRRVVVSANVRGRDLGGFVEEVQQKMQASIKLPPGYYLAYGGQFENLQSATRTLTIVVPVSLLLIFLLLFMTLGTVRDALLVFSGVPLALTGGVAALWLRDISLSISAGVGFIALSGVAVLNGLVMVSFITHLRQCGDRLDAAIEHGALTRLRPVLMTALVAALGFVPMALAHGRGAEVQKPLATVVIGGIISSTLLTLLVLPALYRLFHRPEELASSSAPSECSNPTIT